MAKAARDVFCGGNPGVGFGMVGWSGALWRSVGSFDRPEQVLSRAALSAVGLTARFATALCCLLPALIYAQAGLPAAAVPLQTAPAAAQVPADEAVSGAVTAPAPPTAGALLMPQLRQLVERQLQEVGYSLPVGARIEIFLPPGLVLPQKCLLPVVEVVPNRRPPGPMVPYIVRCAPTSAGLLGASVAISVRIAVIQRVVVAARTLSANVPIAMTDLSLADADISTIGTDALLATGDVVGRVLSRSFPAGAILLRSTVRNPVAIRTGDSVRLEIIGNGFTVSSESVALQNASTGDMLRVRNSEGQTVSGRLDPRGVVVIDIRRSE